MRHLTLWSIWLMLAVFAVTVVGLVTPANPVAAQPAKKAPGLERVPTEGLAVFSINVKKLHDSEALKPIRDALSKGDDSLLKRVEEEYGLNLSHLDRLTVYWSEFSHTTVFVSTTQPIEKTKLLKAWKASAEPRSTVFGGFGGFAVPNAPAVPAVIPPGGGLAQPFPIPPEPQPTPAEPKKKDLDLNAPLYYCGDFNETILVPIDATTLVVLPGQAFGGGHGFLAALLRQKNDGPLAEALALAEKHDVVFGVYGRSLRSEIQQFRQSFDPLLLEEAQFDGPGGFRPQVPVPLPGDGAQPPKVEDEFTPFEPLAEMDRAVATFDFGPTSKLTVTAHFPTAEAAKKAEPVGKQGIQMVVDMLTQARKASESETEWLPLYDFALNGLKAAKVTQDGKTLTATATADIGADLKAALATMPAKLQEAADRMKMQNNLKQIGIALHNYHDVTGQFPRDITDGEGKVLLSWRVELLPYLEADPLYTKIDRTRAWDDPVNKKLWDEMPEVFKVPARATKEKHETYFQTFRTVNWLGKNDPWQVDTHPVTFADVTDGLSNTAAVFEMEVGVNWMKPEDPLLLPKKLAKVGNPKTGKAGVLMLDGSVQTLDTKKYTAEKLVPLLTANGGEVIEREDFR